MADADSPAIRVYVSDGTAEAVGQFDGHSSPVLTLAFNEPAKVVVSADRSVSLIFCWLLLLLVCVVVEDDHV